MTGLYRALLRLYPSAFRQEYADEMTAIFAQQTAGARFPRRLAMLLAAVPEVVANATAVHWEQLRQDLVYTGRTISRAPVFAATVVLVTALGVGANTAAFSVAGYVLVDPLPFPASESVVRLCAGPREGPAGWGCNNQLTPAAYRDYKELTSSFEDLGAFSRDAVNLVGGGEPLRLERARLTPEVLTILDVPALLGTVFGSGTVAGPDDRSVVLSHGLWRARFAGDPGVLGRTLSLDGISHVVVGVMPPTFYFPTRAQQLWTPHYLTEEDYADLGNNYLESVGRLREGVSFEEADADLRVTLGRLSRDQPEVYAEAGISFFRMQDEYSPRFRLMLLALCGASLCILVLACANLANLLLARAGARERELAVRAALGAGRERLARQMVTESAVFMLLGGAAGVLVSLLAVPLLALLVPNTLPIGERPQIDLRMLGVAGLFTALTGLGFGLVPALRAGGRAGLDALRTGLRSSEGVQRGYRTVLVSVQVAASVVLLISCGLLVRAVLRVQDVEPGFDAQGVLTLQTVLPKPEYLPLASRDEFYQRVLTGVRALPGVNSAAYTSGLPMVFTGGIARVELPGAEVRPDGQYSVSRRYVTPQLFSALGVPLLAGRDLEDADTGDRGNVAVVSETFAERYWPGEVAVGREFLYQNRLHAVLGVVGDVKVRGLERVSEPQMYLPASRVPEGALSIYDLKTLVIRTSGSPTAVLPAVREIVRAADPDQPVSDVMTLSDLLAGQTASRRAQVRVLAGLAALALLLAGVGIYGLLSYTVAQRQREIGVRLALGAKPGRVAGRVVWDAVRLVLIGMVPGLLAAYWAARSLSTLLFGIAPADPVTIAAATGLCLATALIGASVPALRAVRVSPLTVIRSE